MGQAAADGSVASGPAVGVLAAGVGDTGVTQSLGLAAEADGVGAKAVAQDGARGPSGVAGPGKAGPGGLTGPFL